MAFPQTIPNQDIKPIEPISWQPEVDNQNRRELTLENFKKYDFTFEQPKTFDLGKYNFTIPENAHLTVYDFSEEDGRFYFRLNFLDGSEEDITFVIENGKYDMQERARRFFTENDILLK